MLLHDDIITAIDKHLSNEVGNALRKRLELINELEIKNKSLEKESAEYKRQAAELKVFNNEWATKENRLNELERDLKTREAAVYRAELAAHLVGLRETHASERVKDMKELVGLVFANSKFKYQEFGGSSLPGGGYSNTNKTIEIQP